MAGSNSFKETVESLFHGMDSVITSKTCRRRGDPHPTERSFSL